MPTPADFSCRIASNRAAVSFSPIADVGSSMMRTELRWSIALAISTNWICPSDSLRILARGSTAKLRRSRSSAALRRITVWLTNHPARRDSRPRKMFSATVMSGTGLSSCVMIAMPAAKADAGEANRVSLPLSQIRPLSGTSSPIRMFRNVDLPAPLPPHRA